MSVDRVDPAVRAALRALPVPEHDPGFWDRLDEALAQQAPVAELVERRVPPVRPITSAPTAEQVDHSGPVPVPVPDRRHPPRRSNRVLALAAVAAGLVVVLAASALVRSQTTSDEVDTAASTSLPGAATDEGSDSATLQMPAGADAVEGGAADTVDAWLAALGEGDTATAWALLGPDAKQHWDGEDAFAASATDLAEGYGAWAEITPDVVVATTLLDSREGSVEVVTLVADLAQEGTTERRVLVLPVRVTRDGARVEPSPVSGGIRAVEPAPSSTSGRAALVEPGGELAVALPAGCASPALRVDAVPPVVPGESEGTTVRKGSDGAEIAAYRPPLLAAGEHVLTAACIDEQSSAIFTLGLLFEVQ